MADMKEDVEGYVGDIMILQKQDLQAIVKLVDLDVLLRRREDRCTGKNNPGKYQKPFSHPASPLI